MNDFSHILADSVERLFDDLSSYDASDPAGWAAIADMGLPVLFLPEDRGGMDASWADAEPVLRACGFHALPFPVGETMIARRLLHEAGIEAPSAPIAFARATTVAGTGDRFSGEVNILCSMPAGSHLLVQTGDGVALLDSAEAQARTQRRNAAGEDRDRLTFAHARCQTVADIAADRILLFGAFLRTAQIAGALKAILERTLRYAGERSQFGRELRKFQTIQHQIAMLAEETAAVFNASASAAQALDAGNAQFAIACAKLRADMATGKAALIAHQVHGAIGIAEEYDLHRFTQRLWAWRSEFGNDRYWARELGRSVLAKGAPLPWETLTQRNAP